MAVLARAFVPEPIIQRRPGARVGVITLGGCDPAVREALDILEEVGSPMDFMRVRGFPFDEPVEKFIAEHDFCYVVEQNRDAQLRSMLILETSAPEGKAAEIGDRVRRIPAGARRNAVMGHRHAGGGARCHLSLNRWWRIRSLTRNEIGLTIRDYEGTMSTLCAGCGHDSITAALIRALWELSTPPHRLAKMSGIGCSSKTPSYFVSGAHGFNSAHGRMPPIATGANAANRELTLLEFLGRRRFAVDRAGAILSRDPAERADALRDRKLGPA